MGFDAEELDFEDERCILGDHRRVTAGTISEPGWYAKLTNAADLHRQDTFVPAFDDPALPDVEGEGLLLDDRTVESLPAGQPARIMDGHLLALRRG